MPLNYTITEQAEGPDPAEYRTNLPTARNLGPVDPLDPAPLLQGFAHYEPAIVEMEDEARAVVVTDDESSAKCVEMAGQSRKLYNDIERARKSAVEPYNGVIRTINNTVKDLTERLAKLRGTLEGANKDYLVEQDRKRREAEAKARAEAERVRREAEAKARAEAEARAKAEREAMAADCGVPVNEVPEVPVHVEPVYVPPVYHPPAETRIKTDSGAGMTVQYEMVPEIADFRSLPDECLAQRSEEIKKAVLPWIRNRGKAGIYNDPGIVWTKQPKVATRASR